MPVNLEIKVKLKSHNEIRKTLRQLGAEAKGILKQKDIYYKNKTGLLKLRVNGKSNELIKYNRVEDGKTRWSNYFVLNLTGKKIEEFLTELFKIETVVEKKRELWLYDNTRIHLDTVKGLGCFMELETLVLRGKKDAEKRFNKMIAELAVDFKGQIRMSYRNLMLKQKKRDLKQ